MFTGTADLPAHDEGRLMWWWIWSGPTRDAPEEYEPLGPAADTGAATDRIARVLCLDGIDARPTA